MHKDDHSLDIQNGIHQNGVSTKGARNGIINGHTSPSNSTSLQTNGYVTHTDSQSTKKHQSTTFFGHDREEVTRLIIQGLVDLGYPDSAHRLCVESGYEVESLSVSAFRNAVLHGRWSEAEQILFGSKPVEDGGGVSITNGHSQGSTGLRFADDADMDDIKFRLKEQKYLELLEERQVTSALKVLRQELTPLHQDREKLHSLSSLIVCQSAEDLRIQARWDGANGGSRDELLTAISRAISPSVMIPEHRLASLLDDFKHNQVANCRYHNSVAPKSLFVDHTCEKDLFPRHEIASFDGLVGEIWCMAFSHNGKYLAVCGKKFHIAVFDVQQSFKRHRTFGDHQASVVFLAWSPDDSKIISCSCDKTAKIWDVYHKQCIRLIDDHRTPVLSATWAPDSKHFITASPDRITRLKLNDIHGQPSNEWDIEYRAQDVVITPDGSKLITSSVDQDLYIYNFSSRREEHKIMLTSKITCLSVTRDSKFILVSLSAGELQLIGIDSGMTTARYSGQKQGKCVIRSCVGGVDDNLVISGSEGLSLASPVEEPY